MQLAINGGVPVRKEKLPIFRLQITEEEVASVVKILQSGQISRGSFPQQVEQHLSQKIGVKHSIVMASGTAALHAALEVLDLPPGSEVILPSFTFVATAFAPLYAQCQPIFADINPITLNIDPKDVERRITPKTKAIIAVDFAGYPAPLDELTAIAKTHSCYLIEDAAHAIGAIYNGQAIGSISDLTTFSFFATKNITGGEGGAVTTPHDELAVKLRLIKAHGIVYPAQTPRISGLYDVIQRGYNFHLNNLNLALIDKQLETLPQKIKTRRDLAQTLTTTIHDHDPAYLIQTPESIDGHAFHLYNVLLNTERLKVTRDQLILALLAEGIEVGVYYKPVHLFSYFQTHFQTTLGQLPHTEDVSNRLLTLPLYPGLTRHDLEDIAVALHKVIYYFSNLKYSI